MKATTWTNRTHWLLALCPLAMACAVDANGGDSTPASEVVAHQETEKAAVCDTPGDVTDCRTRDGDSGMRSCSADRDGGLRFSACGATDFCVPGEVADCASGLTMTCSQLADGVWQFDTSSCESGTTGTPLVLSFDGGPVRFTDAFGQFDLAGHDASYTHSWVSAATPWLALDRNDNGQIDDGGELFGSMTVLGEGRRARHGFEALADLDVNGDGRLSELDPAFSRLLLWRDRDQNRSSSPDELEPLASSGVTELSLDFARDRRCEGDACEVERSTFQHIDAAGSLRSGALVDVHFSLK